MQKTTVRNRQKIAMFKNRIRHIALLLAIIMGVAVCVAQENTTPADTAATWRQWLPKLHGVIRGRYELSTTTGESRFQVRNARLSLDGAVGPLIDYKFNIDLCERGKIKMLDVWGRVKPTSETKIQIGQYRMPFGLDCFRGPTNYIFSNRAAMSRYVANVRGVGIMLGYAPSRLPLSIEGAVFNPATISDHSSWHKDYAYALKGLFRKNGVTLTGGFMSLKPENVRINLWDIAGGWSNSTLHLEAEYMHKHYTHAAAPPVHAFNVFGDYRLPVTPRKFSRWGVHSRFDSMTKHSQGYADADGNLTIDQPTRCRLTIGSTLTYRYAMLRADLRLDYEKYFYGTGGRPDNEHGDRVSLELIINF